MGLKPQPFAHFFTAVNPVGYLVQLTGCNSYPRPSGRGTGYRQDARLSRLSQVPLQRGAEAGPHCATSPAGDVLEGVDE